MEENLEGMVAVCSRGQLGLITSGVRVTVEYGDGETGEAYTGIHLTDTETCKVGDPWSSRNPKVLCSLPELVECRVASEYASSIYGELDALRAEELRAVNQAVAEFPLEMEQVRADAANAAGVVLDDYFMWRIAYTHAKGVGTALIKAATREEATAALRQKLSDELGIDTGVTIRTVRKVERVSDEEGTDDGGSDEG